MLGQRVHRESGVPRALISIGGVSRSLLDPAPWSTYLLVSILFEQPFLMSSTATPFVNHSLDMNARCSADLLRLVTVTDAFLSRDVEQHDKVRSTPCK